jgi:hypothetical protein
VLCDPIGRYDCDLPVDGVAAFVLTSTERARDLPHRAVHVSGYALGTPSPRRLMLHWPLEDMMAAGGDTVRRLWSASGLQLGEVDLPQLYDGFAPFAYF